MKREHFAHFHIAGFSYYEGVLAFKNLKVGKQVTLKHESKNIKDKYAVEIYHEENKLGYIPKGENRQIAKLLITGNDCFEARVQWINLDSYPEGQIGIIVYLLSKE